MKTRWMAGAASAALIGFIGIPVVRAGEIVNREQRQQKRIGQGVQSGELTAKETQRLEKEQAKIETDRKQALADGKMTEKERAKLRKEQDRASRHIHKQKHDAQKQPVVKENLMVSEGERERGPCALLVLAPDPHASRIHAEQHPREIRESRDRRNAV